MAPVKVEDVNRAGALWVYPASIKEESQGPDEVLIEIETREGNAEVVVSAQDLVDKLRKAGYGVS